MCVDDIRLNLEFVASGYPMQESASHLAELSALFQGLGICHLLESLDTDQFRENLVRSGFARRYFLRACKLEGNNGTKYLALSRTEALLDVLAAGDLSLAHSLADLSPQSWNRNWEYEEDFSFFVFLSQLLLSAPSYSLEAILNRFEAALQGGSSKRLKVLRALLARDSRGFELSLFSLLEEEQDRADLRRSTIVDSNFLFWPRNFVSIEGLALLRAAEYVGLPVGGEFPMCPREATLSVMKNNYRDFFSELAAMLSHPS
jgi:hypothetical protein